MKAVCVDDERKIMEYTLALLKKQQLIDEAYGFVRSAEVLDWLKENEADIAVLDIDMPDMNGIELAERIKSMRPDTAIIFLTGYSEYAVQAFELHVSGYLLKPVSGDRLAAEIEYALADKKPAMNAHIVARTFGGFDLFVDGKAVSFKRSKSKELLAYLVDRQGNNTTRAEAFAILWENRMYDRPMQKQLDAIIRSLRDTLKEYDIEEIFELKGGNIRIKPELISCDAYEFFAGKADAVNSYRGEYMGSYSWASMTESYMTWKILS